MMMGYGMEKTWDVFWQRMKKKATISTYHSIVGRSRSKLDRRENNMMRSVGGCACLHRAWFLWGSSNYLSGAKKWHVATWMVGSAREDIYVEMVSNCLTYSVVALEKGEDFPRESSKQSGNLSWGRITPTWSRQAWVVIDHREVTDWMASQLHYVHSSCLKARQPRINLRREVKK